MKKYRLKALGKYNKYFIFENGKLYLVTWYFSLCDQQGKELADFSNEADEVTAILEGYYPENTQTIIYPLVNGKHIYKSDVSKSNRLIKGMKQNVAGIYYKKY